MDHNFYLQIIHHACLPFVRATPNRGSRHPIAAYYSFINSKG